MKSRLPSVATVAWTVLLALLAAWQLTWSPPVPAATEGADTAAERPGADTGLVARSLALQRAQRAVLGLQVTALPEARSSAVLGQERAGSGVLISDDGLVLTIGYLILEADQVMLVHEDGRTIPARVLGHDLATGFGLVQALAPLGLAPAPLARSELVGPVGPGQTDAPMMIVSGGDDGLVGSASLIVSRAFSGHWEYHIEGALFTAPPRRDHSGAGLFNPAGELVGIGSLLVADVHAGKTDDGPGRSGNMFVPVKLLLPILDDLRRQGRGSASQRAWLGLNCVERDGGLRVVRVNDDSPADVAGLQVGDRILRIDGTEVTALAALWQALWAGGAAEREVTLDIERDHQTQTLKVYSVDRIKTFKHAEGI